MPAAIHYLLLFINACAILVLAAFTVRRIVYGIAALADRGPSPPSVPDPPPEVLVLVPCHNEASVIGRLLDAVEKLDYPRDRLRCTVIDDASTDGTGDIARERAGGSDFVQVLVREDGGRGKPEALNWALARSPQGELVAVFDADSLPEPGFLRKLVGHFADDSVASVSGVLTAINPDDSLVSYYVYIEGLVHQMVTMRQASRMGLTPAVLGTGYLIRRSDLEDAGGYREGALLEDSELSVVLRSAGRRVVFDPSATCGIEAPTDLATYRAQHLGWARGFHQVLSGTWRQVLGKRELGPLGKIDALLFSAGYLDRVFLLLALIVTLVNQVHPRYFFPWWLWALILGSPLVQILLCLVKARAPARRFAKLPLVLLFFPMDVLVSLQALFMDILGVPIRWYKTPRKGD